MIRPPAFSLARPSWLDVALTFACAIAMHAELLLRELHPNVLGSAAIVLASLPVLWRRQIPATALALAFVGLFLIGGHDDKIFSTIPAPAVLCAYAVASIRGRRAAVVAGLASLPLVLAILQIFSPHPLFGWSTAQNLALVVLPLSLGVAAHDRRAYTAALVERARTAESNQEQTALRRVSEERLRIARDVHDVVAHALVTINVQAGVGAYLVRSDPDEAHSTLRTIKQVSGDALTDLRSTLGILRDDERGPEPAPPTQGLDVLTDLAENMRSAGLLVTVELDLPVAGVPTPVATTAYRIVQEALTNTLRHAGPSTTARICVSRRQDQLIIEVIDDGGAPVDQHLTTGGSGNGLRGMRERAAALGGSLRAGPGPAGGWRVTAALPLDGHARAAHPTTEVAAP